MRQQARAARVLVVDLAHQGETVPQALQKLAQAINECIWHDHPALKVIHGHGSRSGRATLKPHVLHELEKYARRYDGRVEPDGWNPGAHVLTFPSRRST